jgi:hypothetical protein
MATEKRKQVTEVEWVHYDKDGNEKDRGVETTEEIVDVEVGTA